MNDKESLLTQEQLKQRLSYDPETGEFRWIGRRHGELAGIRSKGYVNITLSRHSYRAHRLAWLYVHGQWPKDMIDHINGVRDDNRIANLRDVCNSVNQQNQKQAQSHNKVGLLGVHWNKRRQRFEATIRVNGKNIFIGRYDDPNEAHAAYLAKKREIHEGAIGAIQHTANCPALAGHPCVCSMPSVPESLGLALTRARVPHAYWRPLINELLPLMEKPTKPEPAKEGATTFEEYQRDRMSGFGCLPEPASEGEVVKHRLMHKVDADWVAASEFLTGLPDKTWVMKANELPDEWRIDYVRRWTGTQIANLWKVVYRGDVLNKRGVWEWEPMPSSRDDEFLARCRFASAEEAIDAAIDSTKGGSHDQSR